MINIKENKGITLVSLIVTIIILLILTGTMIYNFSMSNETTYYNKMVLDIKMINDKILVYYNKYSELPITSRKITINSKDFYEIDLSKLDNITLNYGKDYGKNDELTNSSDVYTIDTELNIYYVQGIEKSGVLRHYLENDEVGVNKKIVTTSVENNSKIELYKTFSESVRNYRIYGNSVQNGTPTTDNPIEIQSVGDIQLEENEKVTLDTPYKKYRIPIKMEGKNLINLDNLEEKIMSKYSIKVEGENVVLTGTEYACITGKTLRQLCPTLKSGEQVTLSLNTTASRKFIYLGEVKFLWHSGESKSITEEDLNSRVYFYNESGLTEPNEVIISNIQIERGNKATNYIPSGKPGIYNIYLKEPLRKIGNTADYIDFKRGKVVRRIKVIDETGTLPLEQSLQILETPIEEDITLPELPTFKEYTKIEILTNVMPSKIEIDYAENLAT